MFRMTARLLIIHLLFAPLSLLAPASAPAAPLQNPHGQPQETLTKEQEAALREAKKLYEEAEKLHKENDYDGAIERVERALPLMGRALGESHQHVIVTLNNLAGMYQARNNYPVAERLFKRVLEIRERKFGPEHPDVAESLTDLGGLYRERGSTPPQSRCSGGRSTYVRRCRATNRARSPPHSTTSRSCINGPASTSGQRRFTGAR